MEYIEYRLSIDKRESVIFHLESKFIRNISSPFLGLCPYTEFEGTAGGNHGYSRWRISDNLIDSVNDDIIEDYKNKVREFLNKIQIGSSSYDCNVPNYQEVIFKVNQYFGFYFESVEYTEDIRIYGMYKDTIAQNTDKEINYTFHLDQYDFEYYKNHSDVYMGFANCRVIIGESKECISFKVQVFSIDGWIENYKRVKDEIIHPYLLFYPIFNKKVIKDRIRNTFSYFKASSVEELKLKISNFSNLSIGDEILSKPLGNIHNEKGKVFKFKELK